MGNEFVKHDPYDWDHDRLTNDHRPALAGCPVRTARGEGMNIITDLLLGGTIFLIIILFRSVIGNHKGGGISGLIIMIMGFLILSINSLYGKIIILAGLMLIIISEIEHKKYEDYPE